MINISYICTHTNAFSVIMIQLIFLLLFTVSPYFSIYLADLPVVTTSDSTYSELKSLYIFTIFILFVSFCQCVCVAWGGVRWGGC